MQVQVLPSRPQDDIDIRTGRAGQARGKVHEGLSVQLLRFGGVCINVVPRVSQGFSARCRNGLYLFRKM
jgi:hypothetical protein